MARLEALTDDLQAEVVNRQNVVRSGRAKVASGMSRSSGWAASELPSSGGLDPYPATDAPPPATPSTAMSRIAPNDLVHEQ
jgi:hypothetical protein